MKSSVTLHEWNVVCDVCGFKYKSSELLKRWDGAMVCKYDWEPHHPQEFIKVIPDNRPLPFTRSEPEDHLTYTPTWGLINSLGDGEITGEYTIYDEADGDQLVNVLVRALMGSTTTFTAGVWTISVPVANGAQVITGSASVLVKGVRIVFGTATLPASSSTVTITTKDTGAQWSDTVPHTWSENDRFEMAIRYSTDT